MSRNPNAKGSHDWRWHAALFAATILVYLPALRGGFIWNDSDYLTKPELRSLAGLGRIWFAVGATEQYYPLLHSAFWVEHLLWGNNALGYHLVNVLLHAANACLLLTVLRRLTVPGAALAAGLFALHPVCVESVAWIAEQKNTLSTLFYLLATVTYLRYDENRERRAYWLALGFFALALLSKSVTATLPGALLVIIWWRRGRLEWKRDAVPLLAWFLLGAAFGLFTSWVERRILGAEGADFELSSVQRVLLAGRVVWFYWGKLIWPAQLIFIYPRWEIETGVWWQHIFPLSLLVLLVTLVLRRRRSPGLLAVLLFFLGSLFPLLGFFNVYGFLFSYVADHWQYLPSLGMFALAAAGLTLLVRGLPKHIRCLGYAAVALPAVLGVLSWQQNGLYRDMVTFYQRTLAANPGCWMAHNNLGVIYADRGQFPPAMVHYEAGLRLKPDRYELHVNAGSVLARTGRREEAVRHYALALKLNPRSHVICNDLGVQLHEAGRDAEAIAILARAIQLKPDFLEAHNNLGIALSQTGQEERAIGEFEAALRLDANNAEAHSNLGVVYLKTGRPLDAITHYREALRIRPDFVSARENLAGALRRTGQLDEAVSQYEKLVGANPDDTTTLNNLGATLKDLGRNEEAIRRFRRVLELAPSLPEAHYNLALALRDAGQVQEARDHYLAARRNKPSLPVVPRLEANP